MAILEAMQKAAIRLLGRKPDTFFGATTTFELEICDLVNEVATDVAKYRDWQGLIRMATITGDGSATDYDLPGDYDRQLEISEVQDSTSWAFGFQRVTDINDFTFLTNRGFTPYPGVWIIYDDQLHFAPAPGAGVTATYPYITKNWAIDADGVAKPAFTADTDTFALPERLLTLGLVWRWRENKGLATGDQEAFIKALDEYGTSDKGSRPIRRNSSRIWPGSRLAWPWTLG